MKTFPAYKVRPESFTLALRVDSAAVMTLVWAWTTSPVPVFNGVSDAGRANQWACYMAHISTRAHILFAQDRKKAYSFKAAR